jgi:hypothetical protein
MSRFDQRAEGAAARRRRDDGDAPEGVSRDDRNAVRNALGTGHKKLEEDLSSLEVLLHSDPSNPNAPVEEGPPVPGDPAFNLAVKFMGKVADDIRAVQQAVTRIRIDENDKSVLIEGLHALGKGWDERAHAFSTPEPVSSAAKYRTAHEFERDAIPALKLLEIYFPQLAEEGES